MAPSGWKRHSRHHQVGERRGCAGALRLDHYAFGSRCQLCSQDTHWLHFSVFFNTLHECEAITTLSPMPGQAALWRESGCSPRKALPGPRSSAPSTSSSSCRSVPLRVYHRRSERHTQTGKTHDICIYSFSYLRPMSQVVRGAAAPGCCGGLLRRRAGGPRGVHKLSRHTPQTRCFTFVWHHSVMRAVISLFFTRVLRCVLLRHVSAHHSMLPLVYRLIGNSTFGGSMFIVAACSMCFTQGLLSELLVQHIS